MSFEVSAHIATELILTMAMSILPSAFPLESPFTYRLTVSYCLATAQYFQARRSHLFDGYLQGE